MPYRQAPPTVTPEAVTMPSSATDGFFLPTLVIPNQFHEDPGLKRAIARMWLRFFATKYVSWLLCEPNVDVNADANANL